VVERREKRGLKPRVPNLQAHAYSLRSVLLLARPFPKACTFMPHTAADGGKCALIEYQSHAGGSRGSR